LNERDALERALHEQGPSKTRLRTLHLISKRILRAIEHQHHHEQRVYFRLAVDQIRDDPTTCVVVMDFTAATLQDEAAHMLRDLILCVISFDPLHSAYATQLSPTTILRISATFALAGNLFWNKLKCSGSLPRLLFFLMVPLPTSRVDTSSIVLVHFYPSTVFDLKSIFGMPNTGEADAMPTHRM
jgi:hypothetical protein